MKIGIDARWIFEDISGIGVYTRELIRELSGLDRENEYCLFFDDRRVMEREADLTGFAAADNFRAELLPWGIFTPLNQLLLPRLLRRLELDVFHSTNYMIPLPAFRRDGGGALKCMVTLHDLIPMLFPDFAPRSRKRRLLPVYRWLMREIVRRTDLVVTVSRASRADIERTLLAGLPRTPLVRVINQGVADVFRPAGPRPHKVGAAPRTIFWVGRQDPYKNLEGLLRAVVLLRRQSAFSVCLRLAGTPDPRYPEAPLLARALGLENSVIWLGYLSEAQLVREYQQADLFVMPSLYEGFGLPVLEAMACGTPVVCADRASLPEVAGDAALLAPPDDHDALAGAMCRILTDVSLADEMSRKGIQRAARFTWAQTARRTLAAYRELTADKRREDMV
ncbi:MAG: glycosyltransferase family 4 protein [Kiritimatiellia bacterium]